MDDTKRWVIRGDPQMVFADTQHGRRILRLMVAVNVLQSLHRSLFETMKSEYVENHGNGAAKGDRMVFMGFIYGALAEALNAFREVNGLIRSLLLVQPNAESARHFAELLAWSQPEKEDRSSFFVTVAHRVRNTIGFHWQINDLAPHIAALGPQHRPMMSSEICANGKQVARYDVADEVFARALDGADGKTFAADLRETVKVTIALQHVIEHAVAQHLLNSGCTQEPINPAPGQLG